ncbi:Chaperone protein dnaJ A6, partial [Dictyocoela muelleri]
MLHYQTLGISKDATKELIRSEYIKKTLINHPNRGGDANSFADIKQSYEILINDEYSQAYNIIGDSEFKFNEYTLLITGLFSKFNLNCLMIHIALLSFVILGLPGFILFQKEIYLVPLIIISTFIITTALINGRRCIELNNEQMIRYVLLSSTLISLNLFMIFIMLWLNGHVSHYIVILFYLVSDFLISSIIYLKYRKIRAFYFTFIRIGCVVSGILLQNVNIGLFTSVIYVLHTLPIFMNIKSGILLALAANYIASMYLVLKNNNQPLIWASIGLNLIFYLTIIVGLLLCVSSNLKFSEKKKDEY